MDFATFVARGIYAFNALVILALCLVFVIRRLLWSRRQNKRGFFPTYTSAGNALQSLQIMVQPKVDYVLAEKLEDEADDDEESDDNDKVAKPFKRQLRQIRLGQPVDRLTAFANRNHDLDEAGKNR
jgi:hypothetical protein